MRMTSEQFREKADEMRRRAERMTDPNLQQEWLGLAKAYEYLAATVETPLDRRPASLIRT